MIMDKKYGDLMWCLGVAVGFFTAIGLMIGFYDNLFCGVVFIILALILALISDNIPVDK